MKKQSTIIITFGILLSVFVSLTAFHPKLETYKKDPTNTLKSDYKLKEEAFEILKAKCNVCHRKQNPFMVFKLKNMEKRAPKIYKMVFVDKRMPKGDDFLLSKEEYNKLKKWLDTQNIY